MLSKNFYLPIHVLFYLHYFSTIIWFAYTIYKRTIKEFQIGWTSLGSSILWIQEEDPRST